MPTDTFLSIPTTTDKPAQVKRRVWETLGPLHRALLATDGSFTLLLQALAGEPVQVTTLSQTMTPIAEPDDILSLAAGEQLLKRSVLLHTPSGRKLIYAHSRIVPRRLSHRVVESLQAGDIPIGLLLRRERYETYRELIDWGAGPLCPVGRQQLGTDRCIYRSYVIRAGGQPIMQVSEYFARNLFEVPHD